ncbi:uncharacterized protein LOC127412758 [Myxocyprinus asiaticus]|uniref:uncharacterized protein LOC127412758 n=1 Tax=Myxocyprinus asiaticus TaxID=70543 RepID=UPI00222168F8|nr:uncharacterized protein LOC127412758 [Myxocyprinus asiaticus]
MLFIFGLLLLLIPTDTCVEMFCRFNQTDPCYTALGHKLYLQMLLDTYNVELVFKKGTDSAADPVFTVKKGKIKEQREYESFRSRSEFIFNNGTLIINSVIRSDSGTYRLEIYNSVGEQTYTNNLQVNVEAPIGSVEVSVSCSSSGEKRVSCSSEGDQLIFNWTLNGQKLEDGNNTIHLDEETSGNITCTVKNRVSHGQNTTSVNRCPGTTTATVTSHLTSTVTDRWSGNGTGFTEHTTGNFSDGRNVTHTGNPGAFSPWILVATSLIALCTVAVVLIVLVIIACHIYKMKQLKLTAATGNDTELLCTHTSHNKHNREDEHKRSDVTPNADVKYAVVGPQTNRNKRKMKEEEVQYGEVTFTPAVLNNHQYKEQEDCVYSQVQTRQKNISL